MVNPTDDFPDYSSNYEQWRANKRSLYSNDPYLAAREQVVFPTIIISRITNSKVELCWLVFGFLIPRITDYKVELCWSMLGVLIRESPIPESNCFGGLSVSSCRGSLIPKSICFCRFRHPHFEDYRVRSRIVLVAFGVLISRITDTKVELCWLSFGVLISRITDSEVDLFWSTSASSCRGPPIANSNCFGRCSVSSFRGSPVPNSICFDRRWRPHFEDHRFQSRFVLVDFGVLISRVTDSEAELFWPISASYFRGSPIPKPNCFVRFRRPHFVDY